MWLCFDTNARLRSSRGESGRAWTEICAFVSESDHSARGGEIAVRSHIPRTRIDTNLCTWESRMRAAGGGGGASRRAEHRARTTNLRGSASTPLCAPQWPTAHPRTAVCLCTSQFECTAVCVCVLCARRAGRREADLKTKAKGRNRQCARSSQAAMVSADCEDSNELQRWVRW